MKPYFAVKIVYDASLEFTALPCAKHGCSLFNRKAPEQGLDVYVFQEFRHILLRPQNLEPIRTFFRYNNAWPRNCQTERPNKTPPRKLHPRPHRIG